jgi:energy-coupling factor transporter transmembrane protein EcfT
MSNREKAFEIRGSEERLLSRYSLLSKILMLISVILLIWVVIVIIGTVVLGYSYNWAGLTLDTWIVVISVLLLVFIVLNIVFFYHFSSVRDKRIEMEKPKPEFINGKHVHVFTSPKGMEGGIFSKTYINIDEHNILRLRTLIVNPEELWSQAEE